MRNTIFTFLFLLPLISFCQKSILDKGFKNTEENKEVAVVVVNTATNSLFQTLTQDLSDLFRNEKGYNTNPSFFNTNFVKDGTFDKLFNADRYKIKKLKLADNLDFLCLGKYSLLTTGHNEFDMISADINLQINFIDVKSGAVTDSRSYTQKGIGISKAEAEKNAIERFLLQLK
jgi:hypothetical protein